MAGGLRRRDREGAGAARWAKAYTASLRDALPSKEEWMVLVGGRRGPAGWRGALAPVIVALCFRVQYNVEPVGPLRGWLATRAAR